MKHHLSWDNYQILQLHSVFLVSGKGSLMRKRALIVLLGLCMALLAFPAVAHAEDAGWYYYVHPGKSYYVANDKAAPLFFEGTDSTEDGVIEWIRLFQDKETLLDKVTITSNEIDHTDLIGAGGHISDGWNGGIYYTPSTDTVGVSWYYCRSTDATGDMFITEPARVEVANELYDVWIGDIRITDLSADDVLGDADEGATVTYDPDTRTLKLDNATITSGDEQYAIYATHDLTIELTGTSTVTLEDPTTTEEPMYGTEGAGGNCVPEATAAIACEGSLTVRSADASNPGTLEVADASSSYEAESPSAIYTTEAVTVRDAIVSASSETGCGIAATDFASYDSDVEARSEKKSGLETASATISGGSVALNSTDGIALDVSSNLTAVSDCTLTLSGGAGALSVAELDSGEQDWDWYQWVTSPIGIPTASLNEVYDPTDRADTYLRIEPVGTLYELTVVDGTGSGLFLARNQITISADPVNDSSHFSHWEVSPSGAGILAEPSSATTTFTMPGTGVTITAVYEPHTLVHHDAKSPTCIDTGWEAYDECTVCGYSTFEETPITDHSWGEDGHCTVCGAIDPDFKAVITTGANGTWQKGTKDGLSFTSNAAFADFQKVSVDGNDLDASNYTVEDGSTIVTLQPSYLDTLSVGKHTLAIVSDTGTAETEFTVLAAEGEAVDSKADNDGDKESLAKTGDSSMLPIAALSILAVASIAVGALALRRSRI